MNSEEPAGWDWNASSDDEDMEIDLVGLAKEMESGEEMREMLHSAQALSMVTRRKTSFIGVGANFF